MHPLFSSMSSTNKVLNNNSIKTASTVVNRIKVGSQIEEYIKKLKDPYKNQLDRQNHVKSTSVVNLKSDIKVQKYPVNF